MSKNRIARAALHPEWICLLGCLKKSPEVIDQGGLAAMDKSIGWVASRKPHLLQTVPSAEWDQGGRRKSPEYPVIKRWYFVSAGRVCSVFPKGLDLPRNTAVTHAA